MATLPRSVRGLDGAFLRHVRAFVTEGKELAAIHTNLTTRLLKFGAQFQELWAQAKQLDAGDKGKHGEYLHRELIALIGNKSKTIQSDWRSIGVAAPQLLEYKASLPPSREILAELARASINGKPVERWIEQEKVTAESTVREVRALTRTQKPAARRKAVDAQRYVTVNLVLDTSYGEAARLLLDLLQSKQVLKVKSHNSFRDALKAELGPDRYDALKDKVAAG